MAVLALLIVGTTPAGAQQFGKNKVQYRSFDWKYIQTTHFDIYFYDSSGYYLANFAAHVAENALEQIEGHLHYQITDRIPIVVYRSHNDFQQTNVVGEYMPEGVGGVTELFKNRVVVPYEGDWEKFRHVVHHELVHAVLNDKFYGGSIQSLITNNVRFMLPIWMNEGLAEYESEHGYDIETDMFIRDAVIGGYLPSLSQLDGYFAYRGGQAFYWYVEKTYGRDKIGELLNRAKVSGSLDQAFIGAFGKTVDEFSKQWMYDLKKIYWPDIADRQRPIDFAVNLTDHEKTESYFNTSPALSPNGDRLAFISDFDGPRSVYVMDVTTHQVQRIVEGETNSDFEELHLISPGIAWSPDGHQIAFSAKSSGSDVIYVIDVDRDTRREIDLDMDAIYSVDWSRDGRRLAFEGIHGSSSDIYTYDLTNDSLANLTADVYSDYDPHWAPDSRTVYFLSDRRGHAVRSSTSSNLLVWNYDYDACDIYSIDADTYALKRITNSDDVRESSPIPGADGRLIYVSEKNGIDNIYVVDQPGGTPRPITNSISGIKQLSVSRDGSRLAFNAWNTSGYDIFMMRMPYDSHMDVASLAPTKFVLHARGDSRADSTARPASGVDSAVTVVTDVGSYGRVRVDPTESVAMRDQSTTPVLPATSSSSAGSMDPPRDALTSTGEYRIKDYKLRFTPDIIQATGNYSSFYGVQGVVQMLFSDMLGNHQLYLASNLQLDLKNSDFILSYAYLPERIDYQFGLFQSSQLLWVREPEGSLALTRFRQFGASATASRPFDRFSRIDASLTGFGVTREAVAESTLPDQSKPVLVPSISYVFDNTENWAFGPVAGSRYDITVSASPKLGPDGVGFVTLMGDMRHYVDLGNQYSLALRGAGGASFGPGPQRFMIGGVDNWLNWDYTDRMPIENAEDFTFLTPSNPLRGFDFGQQIGSKYFLGNMELRFPLFRALVTGPLPMLFQYVSGAVFLDAGAAWDHDFHPFTRDVRGQLMTDQLLLGTGLGARAYVFGIPARLDVGWSFDFDHWSKPKYYLSMGYDF